MVKLKKKQFTTCRRGLFRFKKPEICLHHKQTSPTSLA
jgi:hypothetical protein